MKRNRELEIYIHIPFCVKKCAYCDFLSGPANSDRMESYVEALIREIYAHQEIGKESLVTTIFFGGGTPSILEPRQFERISVALRDVFKIKSTAEITIEANPGTVTSEKLVAYRNCGVNRISFGLQSAENEELELLGRIHTFEEFLESFRLAKDGGVININVDLISAIPKQTVKSWERTLTKVLELEPAHISAYSLIVEDGTPFAKQYGSGCPGEKDLPDEEVEREIYRRTKELLEGAGYRRYEISNYAKEGKECQHNLGYWERKQYLGLGLGAASLIDNTRYHNTVNLNDYIEHAEQLEIIQEDVQVLSKIEQMEEFIFLGLRKMEGISELEFEKQFGNTIETIYGNQLTRFLQEGLLERVNGNIRLTERGIDVSNYVFAEFL